MKKNYTLFVCILLSFVGYSQITFNGCHPLFENQNFTFIQVGTDATGRHIYETTPIVGDQNCGGLGVCEFRLSWSNASNQWEFIADSGNGDFSNPFVIFTNTEASTPNPPSLILGTWMENIALTSSACGGNLSTSNAVLTGDVQDTTLSTDSNFEVLSNIKLVPNPANTYVSISNPNNQPIDIELYSISGKLILKQNNVNNPINISTLYSGVYVIQIKTGNNQVIKKLIVN